MLEQKKIVITGPTASGKTALAAALCRKISGEIISVDSRQVYRKMNIGTGKDLSEYQGDDPVVYHLIDICEPGEKYNVFAFQEDVENSLALIQERKKIPVFCGGTGLYLEAIMESHVFTGIPVNKVLRKNLNSFSREELLEKLPEHELPFRVDTHSKKRLVRAIEIQQYLSHKPLPPSPGFTGLFKCFLVNIPRDERRTRISRRLRTRLDNGLIDEVEMLLEQVSEEDLMYYGLEYKYVTHFVTGKMSREEMVAKLETEIHRYAKRQMTWFRRMERKGVELIKVDGLLPIREQVRIILSEL